MVSKFVVVVWDGLNECEIFQPEFVSYSGSGCNDCIFGFAYISAVETSILISIKKNYFDLNDMIKKKKKLFLRNKYDSLNKKITCKMCNGRTIVYCYIC